MNDEPNPNYIVTSAGALDMTSNLKLSDGTIVAVIVTAVAPRIKAMIDAIVTQAVIEWIPVSDKLPPTELRVLAAYYDGRKTEILRVIHIPPKSAICGIDYEEAVYDEESDAYYYPEGWYEAIEEGEYAFIGPLDGTVTHWAKMPVPPQEAQS